jgi:trigger factor
VKTELSSGGENEVVLAVEVPRDAVRTMYERTLTRLSREAQVPGFRKGRVPKQVVVNQLGSEYIRGQALNDSLPEWYESALETTEIDAVSMPEIDFEKYDEDADFSFTAKVQVRPTPVLGEYKGLRTPKRAAEITDAQIELQLAQLQERFASLTPVEDRKVVAGDFLLMDLAGSAGGQPIEGAEAKDYMVQVGDGNLIPGFEENLLGLAVGEEKEFEVTFPADYHAEELQNKPATFKVAVKEIKEKAVPELDDAFAADASEFETIAELRADVRRRLEEMQAEAVEREFRVRAVDGAVGNASVTVPPAMVEREAHHLYHDLEHTVSEQGMEMKTYLEALEKTEEEIEEELKPRAEMIVRRRLVLEAICAAENMQVSDDELRERIKADAEAVGRDGDQLVLDVYKSGRQDLLRDELLMAKAVDLIVESAVPTEMTEAAEVTE